MLSTNTNENKIDKREIGKLFQKYVIKKFGLLEEDIVNHKWDGYGKNCINIQIKLHQKNKDITLGSYSNYSLMYKDFLLIIGEYNENYELENINFNTIDIKTFYINHSKWNGCFPNRNYNIKKIENMKEDSEQEIDERKKEFYEEFGNYNDNIFAKIQYREIPRNTGKHKDGKEKKITVYIKKEKIYDFFKMFKNVNIMDYTCYYDENYNNIYENFVINDITILQKNKKFNIMYKNNERFFIIPKISFYNCEIILK
jgi:hypothetical protein